MVKLGGAAFCISSALANKSRMLSSFCFLDATVFFPLLGSNKSITDSFASGELFISASGTAVVGSETVAASSDWPSSPSVLEKKCSKNNVELTVKLNEREQKPRAVKKSYQALSTISHFQIIYKNEQDNNIVT